MLSLALAVACAPQSSGPEEFGRKVLDRTLAASHLGSSIGHTRVRVDGPGEAESFVLETRAGTASIVASDPVGAMYGELELAERVERLGASVFQQASTTHASPYLPVRALNLFLTLPWDPEKNEPIRDPSALGDPQRWWFQNEDYWTTLLDLMAEARLDQLDLHGAYDIDTTRFPNLYAYFVDSPSFPEVGVAKTIKSRNLAQLAHVIELAHSRGVKVSLMSYEAQFYTPHNPKPAYESSEANLQRYTREVVEAMIRALPGLDAIGFRIGESGHGAEFFRCYPEAVQASGRDIPLYTRSWITRKSVVVPLAQASADFTVEIKFNGEQWGPPYPIAGGRVPGWHSYSFEDYLSDSNVTSAARMWPGDPAEGGERWPAEPYKIVWQVRANGTHRIFPFYDPDAVRRTVQSMRMGTARGFSVEALDAYFPATPRYYVADRKDVWCDWVHQRDALWLVQWGRLGYDPTTPEEVFERAIEAHLGKDARALAPTWKAASRVIPTVFTAHAFGPDHRDHAPELEWGGASDDLVQTGPFDAHVFKTIAESLALEATGGKDGRLSLRDGIQRLENLRSAIGSLAPLDMPVEHRGAAREIRAATAELWYLADYHRFRWSAAWASAAAEAQIGEPLRWRRLAASKMDEALEAWRELCESPSSLFYKPFTDRLRMGTHHFRWDLELPKVADEAKRLRALAEGTGPEALLEIGTGTLSPDRSLRWRDEAGQVQCTLDGRSVDRAWLLHKPLPSSTFFHKIPMARRGNDFEAAFERKSCGHLIAAEVESGGEVRRLPLWTRATPYLVVPSRPGPTPLHYSSQEALTYLAPSSLDPARHGMLLVATRAWDFHRGFDVPAQRKILDAVRRGMKLLVLQQDYASGRYPLDWFPRRPVIRSAPANVFDPGGALGLERVETDAILWQPIQASEGWEVFGNGGIARCAWGRGEIWLCQARLMQRMHVPGCARDLKKLLELGGREKPVVVIDAGTEGNRYSTSVFCDLMNAYDIPFLTLGEVIADEQGMSSSKPVPGSASLDRVLEGRGEKMVAAWLASRMRGACSRPVPATRAEFEVERARRRKEFLRSIGLDPLPPRSPLGARVTGALDRDGYTIEKIVFESRPGFPVTAHLYLPKGHAGEKLPVIVNPNGHWEHKKTQPEVQARLIDEARAGYLALAVDSPGHSFEGDARIERRGAGTHFDPRLIAGSTTADTVYVWDLMRALDYLETRPEADMARVGITGTSGGGHATMFAFAADERFACAVPCCYPSSFLDGWNNGCDCNHVPGYAQVGDRADVIGIRAPAPVFVIGAREDDEFPAIGTQHTGEKLRAQWRLFGAEDRAWWRLFDGGHGYSQPMREAALGFFDRYLRGKGDGSPVAEGAIATEAPEAPELVCLPDPPADQLTMRAIARENVRRAGRASWDQVVALNGGLPERVPLDRKLLPPTPDDPGQPVTFVSEAGLTIPGILYRPQSAVAGAVFVHEEGKLVARREFPIEALVGRGIACLVIDVRGFGELPGLDPKLMSYLGIADSFAMGWDAARAVEMLLEDLPRGSKVAVVGQGVCGSLVALYAGLMEKRVSLVVGVEALEEWSELFDDSVPTYALQPRVMYGASLPALRDLLRRPIEWRPRGAPRVDLAEILVARLGG